MFVCLFQQAANENKQLEEELQKKTSSQTLSEPDQSGINLVLTGSSQYEQDTARENVENVNSKNVISKSNGTVTITTTTTKKYQIIKMGMLNQFKPVLRQLKPVQCPGNLAEIAILRRNRPTQNHTKKTQFRLNQLL